MLNAILLGINLEDNRQLGPIVIAIAVIVIVGVIIVAHVLKMRDRQKEKNDFSLFNLRVFYYCLPNRVHIIRFYEGFYNSTKCLIVIKKSTLDTF